MGYSYENEVILDSTNLLITILVRYPAIGTVQLDQKHDQLKFKFMLKSLLEEEVFSQFVCFMQKYLDGLNYIENKKPSELKIQKSHFEDITIIEVSRDVDTLTQNEIALIMELIYQKFQEQLITDSNQSSVFIEEELIFQDEVIKHSLETIKKHKEEKKFIAFRENGRVLVFDR